MANDNTSLGYCNLEILRLTHHTKRKRKGEREEDNTSDSTDTAETTTTPTVAATMSPLDSETEDDEDKSIEEKLHCSNCNNLMTQSTKMHYRELEGKSIPKNAEGKALFRGIGVARGKIGGVICDTCKAMEDSGMPITIRSAVIKRPDGTVENISVGSLLNSSSSEAE